jgi:long-chain acyl-CoA synthetase
MRLNLATLVDDWRANGSQTAIVSHVGNRAVRTTYTELAGLAERVAGELARRGIAPGERVVLWGRNSAEWVAAFFGCALRGVIVVPLDAAGTPEFARRVVADTVPRLIVADAELLETVDEAVPRLGLQGLASLPVALVTRVELSRASPLQILYTSGTTSDPKGIVHTHGNILASVEPIEREMRKYRRYERWFHPLRFLHTLPLSHVFGQFMGLWLPPLLGAEVHFESRLEAERIVRAIRRERITVLAAVPRMLDLLRSHLATQNPSLAELVAASASLPVRSRIWRFRRMHAVFGWKFWAFVCGGASLPGDLEQFWSTLGFAVVQGYGMTETAALITLNHPFKISRGSIGKALPGREVRIGPEGEISVRGEMVSTASWQGGRAIERSDPWLATGDFATADEDGNLRFTGRKSETIVNPAGLNIHPEDVEAALLAEPGVTACAVVPVALAAGGHDPAAVLVVPAGREAAAAAIVAANRRLAEFQRVRRWFLWPEADLPRTSIGKVRRRGVAEWVGRQIAVENSGGKTAGEDALLRLIGSVTGGVVTRSDDAARLTEDLGLDSLNRVQLQSAVEQQFAVALDDEAFLRIETLGQLRAAIGQGPGAGIAEQPGPETQTPATVPSAGREFLYPRWPWLAPVQWVRVVFLELVMRPLVWLLLNPRTSPPAESLPHKPMLLIANHATLFDFALMLYGLPGHVRRGVAVAAAGEMLDDWRHGRNQGSWWLNALAPAQYWLLTALFNVFPLPRQAGFRRSFAHIGEALDRGYSVAIFPEGHRSADGMLQPFRAGIGLLAQESKAPVLPVALRGMDELVARRRRWFHAGLVEVRVGTPVCVSENRSAISEYSSAEDVSRDLHRRLNLLLG